MDYETRWQQQLSELDEYLAGGTDWPLHKEGSLSAGAGALGIVGDCDASPKPRRTSTPFRSADASAPDP